MNDEIRMSATDFLNRFLSATTSSQAQEIRMDMEFAGYPTSPYGGMEHSSGSINTTNEVGKAIAELLTNAIDACLELHRSVVFDRRSPFEAAEKLGWCEPGSEFEQNKMVKFTRKQTILQKKKTGRNGNSEKSEDLVIISDKGIGVSASEFGKTLGSFHQGNKVKSFHLFGQYGQGGSAILAHAKGGVLYISRKVGSDEIMFSFVWKAPVDEKLCKLSTWYQTDPVVVSVNDPNLNFDLLDRFNHGTVIMAFGCSLGTHRDQNGPWHIIKARLAGVPLGIALDDSKQENQAKNQIVRPVFVALDDPKNKNKNWAPEYTNEHTFKFRSDDSLPYGKITVRYYLGKKRTTEGKKPACKRWLASDRALVYTMNGQQHADATTGVILREAKLTALGGDLVINVNCQDMTLTDREISFTSSRSEINSVIAKPILEKVKRILKDDKRLAFYADNWFDPKVKSSSNKNLSKDLQKMMEELSFMKSPNTAMTVGSNVIIGGGGGTTGNRAHLTGSESTTEPNDLILTMNPTILRPRSTEDQIIQEGLPSTTWFITNADNALEPKTKVEVLGKSNLKVKSFSVKNGHIIYTIDASAASAGESAEIRATITANSTPLVAIRKITVVSEKQYDEGIAGKGTAQGRAGTKKKEDSLFEFDIGPVDRSDSDWHHVNDGCDDIEPSVYGFVGSNKMIIRYSIEHPYYRSTFKTVPATKRDKFTEYLEFELGVACLQFENHNLTPNPQQWAIHFLQAISGARRAVL